MNKILVAVAILISVVILFISIARANLETVIKEELEDKIRVTPVEIVTYKENGERLKSTYYLPKIKIGPNNILYPIKMVRDKLWLALVKNPCEKSKLLLLLADKQMAEEDGASASDAVDKLIEAWDLCPHDRSQLISSIKAYRQITQKMRKYSVANEKIEGFIKNQKEISN